MYKKGQLYKIGILTILVFVILSTSFFLISPLNSVTGNFTISEETIYGFSENIVYINITDNIGKTQDINLTHDYFDSVLNRKIDYRDFQVKQLVSEDVYGYVNVSLGKYSKTNESNGIISYWSSTNINLCKQNSTTLELLTCDYILGDKSVIDIQYIVVGTTLVEKFADYPVIKEKAIINGVQIENKQGTLTLPKDGTLQLRISYVHALVYSGNLPTAQENKYNITVESTDGQYKTILDPQWLSAYWNYRVNITLNGSMINGTHENFPILLTEANIPNDVFVKAKSDGEDIRFSDNIGGSTELAFEIVSYNNTLNTTEMWVSVNLTDATDKNITLFYNNPSATAYAPSDTYGSQNVWTNNYKLVSHDGGGNDSTQYENDALGGGRGGVVINGVAGKIGNATNFSVAPDQYIVIANDVSLTPESQLTISSYIKSPSIATEYAVVSKNPNWHNEIYTAKSTFQITSFASETTAMSNDVMYNILLTYNETTLKFYLNGISDGSVGFTDALGTGTQDLYIGRMSIGNNEYDFHGIIDEVRILNTTLTPEWINTEYKMIDTPSLFNTEGEPEYLVTNISECGTISSPGNYRLNTSIPDSAETSCIVIDSESVNFDCQGFTIDGLKTDNSNGIKVNSDDDYVTIKNCVITDWGFGINYDGDYGYILNNSLYNVTYGLQMSPDSASNTIINMSVNESKYNYKLPCDSVLHAQNNTIDGNEFYFLNHTANKTISNSAYAKFMICDVNNSIVNNITVTNGDGFWGEYLYNTSIINSNFSNNDAQGFHLQKSTYTNISNCNSNYGNLGLLDGAVSGGFSIVGGNNNIFANNTATSNSAIWGGFGFHIASTNTANEQLSNNQFINNTATSNGGGFYLYAFANSLDNCSFINNTIKNNAYGIYFYELGSGANINNNTFEGNILSANSGTQFYMGTGASNNHFFNNIIYGVLSGMITTDIELNDWNNTISGNYYGNSTGTGFSQLCADVDANGICDEPYDLYANTTCTIGVDCSNNTDYMPLSDESDIGSDFINPQLTILAPLTNVSINQFEMFLVQLNVTCLGRNCGNISVYLDPITGCVPDEDTCTDTCGTIFDATPGSWFLFATGTCLDGGYTSGVISNTLAGAPYNCPGSNAGDCAIFSETGLTTFYMCPSYDRFGGTVTSADCTSYGDTSGYSTSIEDAFDFTNAYFTTATVSKGGLVNVTEGATPFWTNASANPTIVDLDENESATVEYWVNGTGSAGDYTFYAYATDINSYDVTLTNTSSTWTVTIGGGASADEIAPNVTLNSPIDNYNSTSQTINFNCSVYDNINVTNVTLYGNWSGWGANETNYSSINNTDYIFPTTLVDGLYLWNCLACDNSSNCSFAENNFTLYIDSTSPVINLSINDSEDGDQTLNQSDFVCIYANATDDSAINTVVTYINITNPDGTINLEAVGTNGFNNGCAQTFTTIGIYNVTYYTEDIYGNNATARGSFEVIDITPPTCTIISRTPSDINSSSNGMFNLLINCSDPSGINITKVGESYVKAFLMRTVDNFIISAGPPNYFTVMYPNNSLASTGTLTPPFKIWRGVGRNTGFWYDSLGYSTTLNNDTFSYSVNDGLNGGLIITETNPTDALVNMSGLTVINAFRTNFYLDTISQFNENKTDLTVTNRQQVLSKRFDPEAYRNQNNYTMNVFINLHNYGTTTRNLLVYYCNSTYSPSGAVKPIDSANCVVVNTFNSVGVNTKYLTKANSSYVRSVIGVTNGLIGGIKASTENYIAIDVAGAVPVANNQYKIRYMNGTTPTDVEFNQSNTSWLSTNDGQTWIQQNYTFDMFSSSVRLEGTEALDFGIYIEDKLGNVYFNSSLFRDYITQTNQPISRPVILEYNSTANQMDTEKNLTHTGIMGIYVGISIDPDSIGNVTHNLTLRNTDGTFNRTINGSFKSSNDGDIWVYFNTSLVPDGKYRMNVTATAGDDLTDIQTVSTANNFTIDNTAPRVTIIYPTNSLTIQGSQNIALNHTINTSDASVCWYRIVNQTGIANVENTTITGCLNTTFNVTRYDTFNLTLWVNDSAGNLNSSTVYFTVTQPSYLIPSESGGGGGAGISGYNSTIICEYVETFLIEKMTNIGFDYEYEDIVNLTSLINLYHAPDISVSTTESFIEDFENKCNESYPSLFSPTNISNFTLITIDREKLICSPSIGTNITILATPINLDWSIPFLKINIGQKSCEYIDNLKWFFKINRLNVTAEDYYQIVGIKLLCLYPFIFAMLYVGFRKRRYYLPSKNKSEKD